MVTGNEVGRSGAAIRLAAAAALVAAACSVDAPADPVQADPQEAVVEAPAPVAAEGAFAPPTADMKAEVVYARAAAEPPPAPPRSALPEPGQTSVVFVETETEQAERKGALRRLIGSLRRK